MKDVLVSIVNHHHVDLLPTCLDSVLRSAKDLALHVVVLDNASPDGSAEMVRRRYPTVELIAQTHPDGFSANNNTIIGPRLADARYFLLLNDDACLDNGVLKEMVTFMDAHAEVGVAGPRLTYPDGSPQVSYVGFPDVWTQVFYLWGLGRLMPKRLRSRFAAFARPLAGMLPRAGRVYLDNWFHVPDRPISVDWVSGACLMARQETIRQIGLLDSASFFMYYEDTDWCRRAKLTGWSVMFLPHVRVRHHQQASFSPVTRRAWAESGIRYFAKHGTRLDVAILRVNVALKAVITLLVSSAAWLIRSKHRDRLRRTIALQWHLIRVTLVVQR